MGYFIIIRGPLGSGKTTIAFKIAEVLEAHYISIDKVLEDNNLDKVGPKAECIPADNFIKAQGLVLPRANEKLKNGQKVIFDACFYHQEVIEHLIKNLPYPNYVFTLKAPIEVCIERDGQKEKTLGQEAVRAVHKLVSRFDYGIVIDVNKSLERAIEDILPHLPNS